MSSKIISMIFFFFFQFSESEDLSIESILSSKMIRGTGLISGGKKGGLQAYPFGKKLISHTFIFKQPAKKILFQLCGF